MKKEEKNSKKRNYHRYDADFKAEAVAQLNKGRSVKELSILLGVSEGLLYKWKAQSSVVNQDQVKEIKRLKQQVKDLEEEKAILKKALRIFSRSD